MKSKLLSNLPTHVNVGWAKFSFSLKKNLKDTDGTKCYGTTDFNENAITLEETMTDNVAHPTIIHEVCHALLETFGLGGDHDKDEDVLTTSNEFITESCCRSMLMFKHLNPELWKLLFEDYYE
jgi:hypothetical protein